VVLLALPFVAVVWTNGRLVDSLALSAAAPLSRAAAAIEASLPEPAPAPKPLPPTAEALALDADLGEETTAAEASPAAAPSKQTPLKRVVAAKPRGLLVRRARVLEVARAGIRPSGAPVAATFYRPAGLALVGVSALGVGLRDGDVVTRVGGTPARSVGAVVGAASGALRSGAPALGAEVWRGGRRILVTVELPQLERSDDQQPQTGGAGDTHGNGAAARRDEGRGGQRAQARR
jgi:hypothetical protein